MARVLLYCRSISIKFDKDVNGMVDLRIEDDGTGIRKDFDPRKTKSLGLKLVFMLAESQLSGKVKISRRKGTQFHISFKDEL